MIYGIGADIVRIARMQANVERYGDKFAQRILTPSEFEEFRSAGDQGCFLAKRFAAKEAAVKALGTGFSKEVGLRDIGIGHEPGGRPLLVFSPRAQQLWRSAGIQASHLSIADEKEYAIAFVTLVGDGA